MRTKYQGCLRVYGLARKLGIDSLISLCDNLGGFWRRLCMPILGYGRLAQREWF